jgi:hypothetical protein
MSSTLNLSLTDELRALVNKNSGDGTLYATPSEFYFGPFYVFYGSM